MLKSDYTVDGTLILTLTKGSVKRVILICDDCSKLTGTTYANYFRSKISRLSTKTYCRKCSNTRSGVQKRGLPIKKTGPRPQVHASKHHSWKGGKFVGSDGYVLIYIGPKKYRKEHFLVIEKDIGRKLKSGEVIHHIDVDKQNNKIENLDLLANESEHQKVHNSLDQIARLLIRKGLIGYNHNNKTYMAVDKLRELLEQPEEVNQQPSQDGDILKGSTTRERVSQRQ